MTSSDRFPVPVRSAVQSNLSAYILLNSYILLMNSALPTVCAEVGLTWFRCRCRRRRRQKLWAQAEASMFASC